MNETQIQIQFPRPGQWDKFTMTAVFPDAKGFIQSRSYTQDDIPADQAPALAAAVTAIASMGANWQASQVWARLAEFFAPEENEPLTIVEAVELTVEAINEQGGRRMFTAHDYPEFTITDPAAVAFFRHFTKQ